jgi:dolichol-phosphate mannosyltransferase
MARHVHACSGVRMSNFLGDESPSMPSPVSVIVPHYNEEESLPRLAAKLADLRHRLTPDYELEIVLVDDGSAKPTAELIDRCFRALPKVVRVAHDRNRGLGAAIRTGVQLATGDIVCMLDADCTYEPVGVLKLLAALEESGADIAIGSPYHPEGGVENARPWRLFISKCASRLYARVCSRKLYTYTSMMRAYRRPVLDGLEFESDGFVAVTEILLRVLQRRFRVVEVPLVLRSRVTGVSKMRVMRTTIAHLRLMAKALSWRLFEQRPAVKQISAKQGVWS